MGRDGCEARPADVARSVLNLTSWTIGQLGSLVAAANGAKDVFFVGGYVNELSIGGLAYAVQNVGGGQQKALFAPELSPFFGAVGALASCDA